MPVTSYIPPPGGGSFLTAECDPLGLFLPEDFSAEDRYLCDAVTDFMVGEVISCASDLQHHEPGLMRSKFDKAAALGLMGLEIPERYGGLGLSKSTSTRIAEAISIEPSFAVGHNVHTSVATLPLLMFGSAEQRDRYLPKLASGEWVGAYALSESQAGTDAMASRTNAVPSGDGWLLTGEKMWITNAAFADMFIVFGRIQGQLGLTAFLVEREMAGVSIGREEHKLGLNGSSTCRLVMENVFVGVDQILGEPDEGGRVALYALNLGRLKIAASSIGQAKLALNSAAKYASERSAFGKPIGQFGLIREKLAQMSARIFASETMLYRVSGYLDVRFGALDPGNSEYAIGYQRAAEEYAIECAILKVYCTETLDYCVDESLQIHGGYGYTEEFPAARAWRDARVNRIYEGTNEINRLNIVSMLMRRLEANRINPEYIAGLFPMPSLAEDRLRGAVGALVTFAENHIPGIATEQIITGRLADAIIGLYSFDALGIRARRLVEAATSESKWQSAFCARSIVLRSAIDAIRLASDDILGTFPDESEGIAQLIKKGISKLSGSLVRDIDRLGENVYQAGGYMWH